MGVEEDVELGTHFPPHRFDASDRVVDGRAIHRPRAVFQGIAFDAGKALVLDLTRARGGLFRRGKGAAVAIDANFVAPPAAQQGVDRHAPSFAR